MTKGNGKTQSLYKGIGNKRETQLGLIRHNETRESKTHSKNHKDTDKTLRHKTRLAGEIEGTRRREHGEGKVTEPKF